MGSRLPFSLVLLLACSSGGARDGTATGLSVGETTGDSASGATAWVTETDGPTSSSGGTVGMTSTTDPTDPTDTNPTTGVDPDSTGDGSTGPGPVSCADDEAACDAWFLPRGATQWEAVDIGGPAALAPSGPVLAAFDIEAERIGFLVTADELVRVDLDARTWVSKTAIDERFPEVNVEVRTAYSIPAHWAGMPGAPEGITLTGSDVAFLYEYDADTDVFSFDLSTVFGAEWNGPAAPPGDQLREMWLDVTNDEGWAQGDVGEVCMGAQGPVVPYTGVLTNTEVYVLESGYCFAFFPPVGLDEFIPTSLAGAPPADRIGGIAYNESTGLVVFAAD